MVSGGKRRVRAKEDEMEKLVRESDIFEKAFYVLILQFLLVHITRKVE
jgi:hypothetical protein